MSYELFGPDYARRDLFGVFLQSLLSKKSNAVKISHYESNLRKT